MESIKLTMRNHETWLDSIGKTSRRTYERAWDFWKKYLGDKNEEWVLEHKLSEDWGAHLLTFHRWVKKQPKTRGKGTLSDNSANQIAGAIRGYMNHVGLPISLTRAQKDELTKVESLAYKDYVMDLETKELLLRKADPVEEYIVSAGISFGLRVGDFAQLTRGLLEPLMNKEVPIQVPQINTQKRGEVAYPFIDGDAKQAIERLLKQMDREGRTSPDESMIKIVDRRKHPANAINTILQNLGEKAGLNLGNYRLRFHCLRKFLTDKLASVCAGDKWKWFVGKANGSPYVSHEGREAYKLVMRFTQVNGKRARGMDSELLEKQLELRDNEISILKNEVVKLRSDLDKEKEARASDYQNVLKNVADMLKKINPDLEVKYEEFDENEEPIEEN